MWSRSSAFKAVLLLPLACLVLGLRHPAQGQDVVYTGSVQMASGDYIFTERTRTVYVYNGLTASEGRFRGSLSVPLIYQTSPWISSTGAGAVPTGGMQHGVGEDPTGGGMMGPGGHMGGRRVPLPDTASYANVGLGDPSVQARVALLEDRPGPLSLAAVGHVKVPLADVDRGFGTGAWDFGAGLSLSKALGSRFLFLDLTYWWLGDLPELELQNALGYSAAFGQPLFEGKLAALLSLSGYTEILGGVAPPVQAGLGLTYWVGGGHGLSATTAFGLTEATPDLSFGVGWRVAL